MPPGDMGPSKGGGGEMRWGRGRVRLVGVRGRERGEWG